VTEKRRAFGWTFAFLGKNQRKSETKQDLWQIGGAGVFGDSGMRNGETQRERVGFCIFFPKIKGKGFISTEASAARRCTRVFLDMWDTIYWTHLAARRIIF
jgi:hypothetical protein